MGAARILVADDQELIRKRVCSTLEEAEGLRVCAEATNGQEAVDQARKLKPDLIILDITMPVLNGLDAARLIQEFAPEIPIIILSVHKSRQLMEEAQKIGVRGYVTKAEAGQNLVKAVRAVLAGGTHYPADL